MEVLPAVEVSKLHIHACKAQTDAIPYTITVQLYSYGSYDSYSSSCDLVGSKLVVVMSV